MSQTLIITAKQRMGSYLSYKAVEIALYLRNLAYQADRLADGFQSLHDGDATGDGAEYLHFRAYIAAAEVVLRDREWGV